MTTNNNKTNTRYYRAFALYILYTNNFICQELFTYYFIYIATQQSV